MTDKHIGIFSGENDTEKLRNLALALQEAFKRYLEDQKDTFPAAQTLEEGVNESLDQKSDDELKHYIVVLLANNVNFNVSEKAQFLNEYFRNRIAPNGCANIVQRAYLLKSSKPSEELEKQGKSFFEVLFQAQGQREEPRHDRANMSYHQSVIFVGDASKNHQKCDTKEILLFVCLAGMTIAGLILNPAAFVLAFLITGLIMGPTALVEITEDKKTQRCTR